MPPGECMYSAQSNIIRELLKSQPGKVDHFPIKISKLVSSYRVAHDWTKYTCEECEVQFSLQERLKTHRMNIHEDRDYTDGFHAAYFIGMFNMTNVWKIGG